MAKTKKIIYIIILILAVAANVYYFLITRVNKTSSNKINLENETITEHKNIDSNDIDNDYSVLENQLFIKLQKIGDWPVVPRQVGRTNPFLPFFE